MSDHRIDMASTMAALGETRLAAPGQSDVPPALGETRLAASGQSDVPPGPSTPEATRFTRLMELGAGGMGVVNKVWDGDLVRELAIKRIRPEMRGNPGVVAMFLWEARVTAYLDHPNIVPVHDLGRTAGGDPYFAMKRVAGGSMAQVLARLREPHPATVERWPLPRRIRMLHQVCMAMAFAHARGILHRDLKPANIMLGDAGEVMVMDWGLALPLPGPAGDQIRAVAPAAIETTSAGTPMYMSPEQAAGAALDQRSDVYTLGVILWELTSLARPTGGELPPIEEVWPQGSRSLAAVIECAVQRRPDDRYADVRALAADFERVIDGRTTVAEHAAPTTRFARFYMNRHPRLANLRIVDLDMLGVGGFAVGLGLGAWLAGSIGRWWWLGIAIGLVFMIWPIAQWLRPPPARS